LPFVSAGRAGEIRRCSEFVGHNAGANGAERSEQLARFFHDVLPTGLPAVLQLLRGGSSNMREAVVIEFAGPDKAIFNSRLPLGFEDRVQIENERGYRAKAKVIAARYHDGKTAVAVQFVSGTFLG
jgi:hypothetical protein